MSEPLLEQQDELAPPGDRVLSGDAQLGQHVVAPHRPPAAGQAGRIIVQPGGGFP